MCNIDVLMDHTTCIPDPIQLLMLEFFIRPNQFQHFKRLSDVKFALASLALQVSLEERRVLLEHIRGNIVLYYAKLVLLF